MQTLTDEQKRCPKCGKTMTEEPNFLGLWRCADSKICLNPNDGPPFKFKCDGNLITQQACDDFEAECMRIHAERN